MGSSTTDGLPRTLLLALDAVPYRVAREAYARGAFAGWARPSALVAPFPSLTHPSFAALFQPFGVPPSWGYEVRYFDTAANRMAGANPLTYRGQVPPWSTLLDTPHVGVAAKVANYVSSPRAAAAELERVLALVRTSPHDVVLAYLGATDGFTHLYRDDALVEFLVALGRRLPDLTDQHAQHRGRRLRVVLYSDHGCGRCPVHYTGDLRRPLRDVGLRAVKRLAGPDDVVALTFGIVNYSALYLQDPRRAEAAAEAMASYQGVELAAYAPEPALVEVRGPLGRARVRWRGTTSGIRYSYEDLGGDVLRLADAARRLASSGLLDAEGYGHEEDWLRETAFAAYPDPLRRLADALTGRRIRSRASVLLSLSPCWSWGWRSAFVGGLVRGGRLKGTHGGLDREGTLGFLVTSDPASDPPAAVRADHALAPFADVVRADRRLDGVRP